MRIRNLQVTRKTEEIIKKYMLGGKYPTFRTITGELSEWLQAHMPGVPSFNFRKIHKKSTSSSNRFNEEVDQIDEDLRDAYSATIDQTKETMKNFNQSEVERNRVRHELNTISSEIDHFYRNHQATA